MTADFVTTLHFPHRDRWNRRGVCLTKDDPWFLRRLIRVLLHARAGTPVVLNGFSASDRIAGILLARLRRRVPLVIVDATWKMGSGLERITTRLGVRLLAGPRTTFCVSSEAERALWPTLWGVPLSQLTVVPWHHGVEAIPATAPAEGDGSVFSGGHAQRDYRTLLAAAERTGAPVIIAADSRDLPADVRVPGNVRVGRLSRAEFHRRLHESSLVVVPIVPDTERSAGQTTFLDAMALGGLVCVSDVVGIAEHITDKKAGLLVPPGDPQALAEAITWALDPGHADAVRRIRLEAQRLARARFAPERFTEAILAIVDAQTRD